MEILLKVAWKGMGRPRVDWTTELDSVSYHIEPLALAETVQAKVLVARSMTAEAKAQYVALL